MQSYTYLQYLRTLSSRTLQVTDIYNEMNSANLYKLLKDTVRSTMQKASNGLDETKDFGGDLYLGGDTFDKYNVKRYIRDILDDCFVYLQSESGSIYYDLPHIMVASSVLKYSRGRTLDSVKVLSAGLLLNAESISNRVSIILKKRPRQIRIALNSGSFEAGKTDYTKRYMMYLTIPRGFKCYLYEPRNIAQIALLSSMGVRPDVMNSYIGDNKNGLIIGSIPQFVETLLSDMIFRNKVKKMDGYFGRDFKTLYAQYIDSKQLGEGYSAPFYYLESILPIMCSLMDSAFFQPYLQDLSNNVYVTEDDCFINYITPTCVSVCIRGDIDVMYLLPSIASKLTLVNPRMDFSNVYNYV